MILAACALFAFSAPQASLRAEDGTRGSSERRPHALQTSASTPPKNNAARPQRPALPKDHLPVPLAAQAADYSCGAAALLSTLWYWNAYDGNETGLYAALGTTPKDGTEPDKIAAAARSFGLEAAMREGQTTEDLRRELAEGDTVILDLQAWRDKKSTATWAESWEDGHYAVLVGMDADYVYLMDPSAYGAYAYLPLSELDERWHDYENRRGPVVTYRHLGIVIRGRRPLEGGPAALIRVE